MKIKDAYSIAKAYLLGDLKKEYAVLALSGNKQIVLVETPEKQLAKETFLDTIVAGDGHVDVALRTKMSVGSQVYTKYRFG